MNEATPGRLIDKINTVLQSKRGCTVNIVNDKLTLSVFALLRDNLLNVSEINFVIRDTRFLPETEEVTREFEIDANPKDMLFNQYDIVEKNKLTHFATAKAMYDFISRHINVRITRPPHSIRGNPLTINDDFMVQGSSSLEISNKASRNRAINIDFDTVLNDTMDKSQIEGANAKFAQLWHSNELPRDFKEELLKTLSYVYKEHCPEFLYYFMVNEIFGNQLDHGVERFERDNTQFKKTDIWNALFDFQKDRLDFMPGYTDIDAVYEILLRQRDIPLSAKVEKFDIGKRTYMFADAYIVCLDDSMSVELVEALAAVEPTPIKYVFRDSAFDDNISLKDETIRRLEAYISRNSGEQKKAYTVEFI